MTERRIIAANAGRVLSAEGEAYLASHADAGGTVTIEDYEHARRTWGLLSEGAKRWDAYHRRAIAWDGSDPRGFAAFRRGLANGLAGCSCDDHWRKWCDAVPFTAINAAEAFALSVADHNAVNAQLGRLVFDEEKAWQRWAARSPA